MQATAVAQAPVPQARVSGTALPDTHIYMSAVHDLHEFRVGAVREFFVDFKATGRSFDLHILDSIHKIPPRGISHGHAGKTVLFSIHRDRLL